MALLATVDFDELLDFRFDAECYRPELQAVEQRIANLSPRPLEKVATVSDGNHVSIASYFCDSGVRYLKGAEVSDVFIDDSEPTFIPQSLYEQVSRAQVFPNDVLLSVIGSVGPVAWVTDKYEQLSCSCKLAILRPYAISGALLTAYLLSPTGQALLLRRNRGSVQQGVVLPDVRTFPVPTFSEALAQKVEKVMADAITEKRLADSYYPEAEAELLERLGWDELQRQSVELTYVRDFDELNRAARADAEFFQPRTQKIHAKLSIQKRSIRDVAQLREELFRPQSGKSFQYIEIGNISANSMVSATQLAGEDAPSRAKYIVHPNDVITSTVRPIRRLSGLISQEQEGWVCSSGFAVLNPVGVPPEYLVAYLRLPPVCELMDAYTTSTMYPAIAVSDLLNLPIFVPEKRLVERMCEAVHQGRNARIEAEKKLNEAKRLVEEALTQTV